MGSAVCSLQTVEVYKPRNLEAIENRTKEDEQTKLKKSMCARTKAYALYEVQALGLLVSVSCMHYCTSTSDLSNSQSTSDLTQSSQEGYLILRCASRLDAFSVYHIRTWLPGYALGRTTDAPAVRPTRSSRTKVSSSQISYAHDRQGPNCLTTF